MRIARSMLDRIVAQARAEAPNECCGMIAAATATPSPCTPRATPPPARCATRSTGWSSTGSRPRSRTPGHELGAIYHSHTRSAPLPSQTDINLAFYPDALYLIVGVKAAEARRRPRVAHRRRRGRGGGARDRGGLTWPRRSCAPACGAGGGLDERFCPRCGSPLVFAPGVAGAARARTRPRRAPARCTRPTRRASSCGSRPRSNQPEAELLQGLLLDAGVPSLVRRSGGFDVPDFLAAGPRDMLVPRGGEAAAREVLGDRRPAAAAGPRRARAPWVRALAFALAVLVVAFVAASVIAAIAGA